MSAQTERGLHETACDDGLNPRPAADGEGAVNDVEHAAGAPRERSSTARRGSGPMGGIRRGVVIGGAGASAAVGVVIGYEIRKAVAEGAPTINPLYFSGMLTEGGVPVDEPRRHDRAVLHRDGRERVLVDGGRRIDRQGRFR